ncbi:MAG: hypothetical protein Q3966_02665 [Neisseria sp.]|nr:hypothetical protein [Neisseria sp.]
MAHLILHPLQGLEVAGRGHLDFGRDKGLALSLLGEPAQQNDHALYYDLLDCHVYFDRDGIMDFFDIPAGPFLQDGNSVEIYGHDPFAMPSDELYRLLAGRNDDGRITGDAPYSFRFCNINVAIWRETYEEEIRQLMLEFPHEAGLLAHELPKGNNYWSIGIGAADCYSKKPKRFLP